MTADSARSYSQPGIRTAAPRGRVRSVPCHSARFLFRCLTWLILARFAGTTGILRSAELESRAVTVVKGLTYQNVREPDVPWSIHIARLDLSSPELELQTALARGTIAGVATLSDQVKSLPPALGRPVAAVNGDFFRYESTPYNGDPRGLQILRGELVSAPVGRPCFWVDAEGRLRTSSVVSRLQVTWPNGETTPLGLNEERRDNPAVLFTPTIGRSTFSSGGRELVLERAGTGAWLPLRAGETYTARVREVRAGGNAPMNKDIMVLSLDPLILPSVPAVEPGAVLKISTEISADMKEVNTAIGGGPTLVHEGQNVVARRAPGLNGTLPYEQRSVFERHPRTAIGWNKKFLFLVEVDGRQPGLSVGMTLSELADYFIKLGCDEAMNLDGGGSATLWISGRVMNSPCDGHERAMANSLIVVRKESVQPQ